MFNIFAFLLSPRNQSRFSFNCCWSLAGCGYQKFKALLCLQILVLCWWMVYSNRGWLDATWTGKRHSNVCGWCNGFAISYKLMLYGAQTRTKWQSVESLSPCSEAVELHIETDIPLQAGDLSKSSQAGWTSQFLLPSSSSRKKMQHASAPPNVWPGRAKSLRYGFCKRHAIAIEIIIEAMKEETQKKVASCGSRVPLTKTMVSKGLISHTSHTMTFNTRDFRQLLLVGCWGLSRRAIEKAAKEGITQWISKKCWYQKRSPSAWMMMMRRSWKIAIVIETLLVSHSFSARAWAIDDDIWKMMRKHPLKELKKEEETLWSGFMAISSVPSEVLLGNPFQWLSNSIPSSAAARSHGLLIRKGFELKVCCRGEETWRGTC